MKGGLRTGNPHDPRVNLRVKFDGGRWQKGKLVERVTKTNDFVEWKVVFDDGTVRDDICFSNSEMFTVFEEKAYGSSVEIMCADENWYKGRLVTLLKGDGLFGVEFDDGDWVEDVKISSKYLRYTDDIQEAKRQKANNAKQQAKEAMREKANNEKQRANEAKNRLRKTSAKKRYKDTSDTKQDDEAPKFNIERISGYKTLGGVRYLKIRWMGYGAVDDSWESFKKLREDVGTKHVRDLLMQYKAQ
jgi:hypothetical protein